MTHISIFDSTIALMLLSPLTFSSDARSAEMCVFLQEAYTASDAHFVPLRGDFDFSAQAYRSNLILDALPECTITGDAASSSLQCQISDLKDEVRAKVTFQNVANAISRCLGSNVREKKRLDEHHRSFVVLTTDDDIEVHYQQLRSGDYLVALSFNFDDFSR